MQNLNHPELVLTWGSEFPDNLKIRKEITLWPLRFKLRADYCKLNRNFQYGCSCKVQGVCNTIMSTVCLKMHAFAWAPANSTPSGMRSVKQGLPLRLQDALFGGRVRLDIPSQQIEYRYAGCSVLPKHFYSVPWLMHYWTSMTTSLLTKNEGYSFAGRGYPWGMAIWE